MEGLARPHRLARIPDEIARHGRPLPRQLRRVSGGEDMEDVHVAALIEDFRGQFRVFGAQRETLQSQSEKLDRLDAKVDDLKVDMADVKDRLTNVDDRLTNV